MSRRLAHLMLALAFAVASATLVRAQSAPLTGTVVDNTGGAIPGATVLVTNNATKVSNTAVTNTQGLFIVPALNPGVYTVTITLQGFKTAVLNNVQVLAGTPREVKATLEVGALTETVEVRGGTQLVNTQTPTVSSTVSVDQISNLPLSSRNVLNAVMFLPGVETIGGVRNSTIMGLPQNTINITIDGVSNSNNFQSGDGFFSLVTPRLDAVEEVTVTGATPGAAGAGGGAVGVAFVTRSGTNQFDTSIYHYFRHPSLNTNYFFNEVNGLDKNDVIVHQYGFRVGGPMIIPGLYDGRGKAFFFFNYEHFYQPTQVTRTRTILNEEAMNGIFGYNVTSGGVTTRRTVNLMALAAANGQTATFDPTLRALLASIRSGALTTGTITTPPTATNTQSYVFQADSKRNEWAPTGRVDFNLTPQHRLTGAYYWQRFHSDPDILNGAEPIFPGMPNYGIQASYRTTGSVTLRSTIGSGKVNEVKGGWQWSPVDFYGNVTTDMFANQQGFSIGLPLVTSVTAANTPQPRNTTNWNIDDNFTWLKGAHSLSLGFTFMQVTHNQNVRNAVPTIGLGVDTTNDPARLMFNTTNIPGASNNDLGNARSLYALMTGRVTSIGATGRLTPDGSEYIYNGNLNTVSKMNEFGIYAQDSWRWTPNVTLNYGARWEVGLPFQAVNGAFTMTDLASICGLSGIAANPKFDGRQCNLFDPGNTSGAGVVPSYVPFVPGKAGYSTDWNNIAPNIGVAWRPNVQDGWLRGLLGDPEQATLRGGYSWAFNRERMDRFTGLYGGNPGGNTGANRNVNNGNLVLAGETWPLLLREQNRLGPPATCPPGTVAASCMASSPTYPIVATTANSVNIFAPDLQIPYTESWTVGWQRALSRDMAFELRYVGNRNKLAWTTENWNTHNIFENGFLDEFKIAQANLAANVASGVPNRVNSFAYFGPGTGTQPLPTYMAYLQGLNAAAASNPASYTSSNWSSTTWTGHLGYYEPDPYDAANDLHGNATQRSNAIAAGLPANYFVMNPVVGAANVTRAVAGSRYHSLQFDLRRRLSQGLTATFNYAYAYRTGSTLYDLHYERFYLRSANVPHAFKWTWQYEIPVGRGRRFGTDMHPVWDGILGGWEWSGTGRVQWQQYTMTDVKLFGMSLKELNSEFKIRKVTDPTTGVTTVYTMAQDIIDNTRRAFATSSTSATGYGAEGPPTGRYIGPASDPSCLSLFPGDCGAPNQYIMLGQAFTRVDMRIKKRFPFGRKASAEVDFEILNVFDNINFNQGISLGGTWQVTSAYTDINTTYDPGGRIGQIVWRISF